MSRSPSPWSTDFVWRSLCLSPPSAPSPSPSLLALSHCSTPHLNDGDGDLLRQPPSVERWSSDCSLPFLSVSPPSPLPVDLTVTDTDCPSLPALVVAVAVPEGEREESAVVLRHRAVHRRRRERERCAMERLQRLVEGGERTRTGTATGRSGRSRRRRLDRLSLIEAAAQLLDERSHAHQSALLQLSERVAQRSRGLGWAEDGAVALSCTTADTGEVCSFDSLYAGSLLSLGAKLGNWCAIRQRLEEAHARGDATPELSLSPEQTAGRVLDHVTGSANDPRLSKFISPLYLLLRGTRPSAQVTFSAFRGGRWIDKVALVWIAARSGQPIQRSLTAGCLLAFACRPDEASEAGKT